MKDELRIKYKFLRKELENKRVKDSQICDNFLNSNIYKKSKTILVYYPLKDEINTLKVIKQALIDRKRIGIPKCLDNVRHMEFYLLKNINDVKVGSFGIMESKSKEKVVDFNNAVCIVPGFTFDLDGFRVGYGKGYYDCFLKDFRGIKVGFCYEDFLEEKIDRNQYDVRVDYICTETSINCVHEEIMI